MNDALNLIFGLIVLLGSIRAATSERKQTTSNGDPNEKEGGLSTRIMGVVGTILGAIFVVAFGGALLGIPQCEEWRNLIQPYFSDMLF